MAPKSGNSGGKNPHMHLVHGKMRFNPNTNVPVSHAGCMISAQAKVNKEKFRKEGTKSIIYKSNAKGMFHLPETELKNV